MPDPIDLTRGQLLDLVEDVYPGDFSGYTKDQLLGFLRKNPTSRFATLMTSSHILALIESNRKAAKKAKATAKKKEPKFRRIAGKGLEDPRYDIEVEFSEDGEAFSNPIDVESNKTYQVRMRLRQHQTDRLAIGFTLEWKKTSNLSWADGKGAIIHAETVSNPLIIARKVRTGTIAANTTASVKVVIVERYT